MKKLSLFLLCLLISSLALSESVKGLVPAKFVLRNGDTMTGLLVVDVDSGNGLEIGDFSVDYEGNVTLQDLTVLGTGPYVLKAGDTMTGQLLLDPTAATVPLKVDCDWSLGAVSGIEFTSAGSPSSSNDFFLKFPLYGGKQLGWFGDYKLITGNIYPAEDNWASCGLTANRWSNVFSWKGDFYNRVTFETQTDNSALLIYPKWSIASFCGIDMSTVSGTPATTKWFLKIADPLGSEYDGIRSDGAWKVFYVQAGQGEPTVADGNGKCLLAPFGIYAEPNLDASYPIWNGCLIDGSNYTGSLSGSDLFFNAGNGGGLLPVDVTLSLLGVLTCQEVNSVADDHGKIGSITGTAWAEGAYYELSAKERMILPEDIETWTGSTGTTYLELSYQDTPTPQEEILTIGNSGCGEVSINARGTVLIKTDGPQDEEALRIDRGGTNWTYWTHDGALKSNHMWRNELVHIYGFTTFPAYEQTDNQNDVGYYGTGLKTIYQGSQPMAKRVWIDFQTEVSGDYISNIAIVERSPTAMTLSVLWDEDGTWGSGSTSYISTYVDVDEEIEITRLTMVRITCSHLPANWIRVARVAVEFNLEE